MKAKAAHVSVLSLFLLLLSVASSAHSGWFESTGVADAPWRFSASLYGWLPKAPARIKVEGDTIADLPESLDTILDSLEFAFMARFDARKGPFGLYVSPMYYKGDYDDHFTGAVSGQRRDFEIRETVWFVDYGLSYEVGRWDLGESMTLALEPYAGFRWFYDKFRLEVDPIDFPGSIGDGLRVSKNLNSNSPVIGLATHWKLSDRVYLHLKGDYGGFGVDNMEESYQGIGWLAYHFKWGTQNAKALAGYRYVALDLEDDRVAVEVKVKGPLVGIGFEF